MQEQVVVLGSLMNSIYLLFVLTVYWLHEAESSWRRHLSLFICSTMKRSCSHLPVADAFPPCSQVLKWKWHTVEPCAGSTESATWRDAPPASRRTFPRRPALTVSSESKLAPGSHWQEILCCPPQISAAAGERSDGGADRGAVLQREVQPAAEVPPPAVSAGGPGTETHLPAPGGEDRWGLESATCCSKLKLLLMNQWNNWKLIDAQAHSRRADLLRWTGYAHREIWAQVWVGPHCQGLV